MAACLGVLLLACASRARAGEDVDGDVFASGTSFESREAGSFDYRLTDEGQPTGQFFWSGSVTSETATVTEYASGEAYVYSDHTDCEGNPLVRNPYLVTSESEKFITKYLSLNPDQELGRSIFSRLAPDAAYSNVLVKTDSRDSIYCDLLAKFTAAESDPVFDEEARISVWAEVEDPESATSPTNLYVSAGAFTNGFTHVSQLRCQLDCPIDPKRWYRLTIRAHGDVSAQGIGLAGFSIYLDGQPVRATAADYKIVDGVKANGTWLTPEARSLLAERRLFFGYAEPGDNKAHQISGFAFEGDGFIDDVTFSSTAPGYGKPQAIFTLRWDSGLSLLKYTLDGGLTTNEAPVSTARSLDIPIGNAPTNGLKLAITDFAYDTERGFLPGVWMGQNGATLTNDVEFVYDGTNRNPIAIVASTRDSVTIGAGGFDVFASAMQVLDAKPAGSLKLMVLESDIVVTNTSVRDAYGNRDEGYVKANNAEGEYVLDLNGHTLQGNPKSRCATIVVGCRSFRIMDSSVGKTGRILPPASYTNEKTYLNTAVRVHPSQKDSSTGGYVEPVLTIESGIMDGWVRNDGQVWNKQAWTGVVIVEGGEYISTNSSTFYLDSCVTNPTSQFVYRKGYWSCQTTDAYIWTGEGDDNRWKNRMNWRSNAYPPAGKTALFPSREPGEGPWQVDVGNETMTTTNLWLEGDVYLTGTNHFEDVNMTGGGSGRFCGTATLLYEGVQPGSLTATTLATNWAGTVVLRAIKTDSRATPLVLRNIDTWGTKYSTVEFNGVRGYVRDTTSRTMEYKLRLRDYVWTDDGGTVVTNAAWQNDSGYTGSILAFKGSLLGDGTFSSGANTRAIYQLFKFADVADFTGRLVIKGKRVLIGNDSVSTMKAGLVVFATQAVVPLNCGWECKRALFGSALNMLGETNQVLIACSDAEPDVTCCTNTTLNGLANLAWLAVTNSKPWQVYATGVRPSYIPEPPSEDDEEPSAANLTLLSALAASPSADDDGFGAAAAQLALAKLAPVALASAAPLVEDSDVSISIDDETVAVTVSNAVEGLWYGLRHRASLADEWEEPTEWVLATGPTVLLTCDRTEETGFYGVAAVAVKPETGGTGQ